MTNQIKFTKMHGAGNDYIYINTMEYPLEHPGELAIRWSASHTGIGSDGLVLLGSSEVADFSMRIFNADGSEALMCGNASRCIGKYVYEAGLTRKQNIQLETRSGIKALQLIVQHETVNEVTVDMDRPGVGERAVELEVAGETYVGTVISMGNPHLVIFVEDINKVQLSVVGPLLENHAMFPNRTNVEFVQQVSADKVRMRVWERGSGITQACGTGACATAVAGVINGKTGRSVQVLMDGGPLHIRWDEDSDRVFMTGDAVRVYEGTICL